MFNKKYLREVTQYLEQTLVIIKTNNDNEK